MAIVNGHIKCNRCGEMKPLDAFAPSYVKQGNGRCRPCLRDSAPGGKKWAASASPEEIARYRAMTSRYHQKHRTRRVAVQRARRMLVDYGISVENYDAMLAQQGGGCACCGTTASPDGKRLHVDHDHSTGAVRGLLCSSCNHGIGHLGDGIDGVRRALAYLEHAYRQPPVPTALTRILPAIRINLLGGGN